MSGYRAAMLTRCVLFTCVVLLVGADIVTKKLCKDVDTTQCTIHSVSVAPCARGPAFCVMKTKKNYGLTLDLTPHFTAQKLKLGIYGDVINNGTFDTVIKVPDDGCSHLTCPLQAEDRRLFDVDLILDKRASVHRARHYKSRGSRSPQYRMAYLLYSGKFPVKVKLWNEENSSQACCFTFTVKVK